MLGRFRRKSRVQSLAVALSAALLVTLGVPHPLRVGRGGRRRPDQRWWALRRRHQARLADHPREQVLRRDLHRPQQQLVPVADPPVRGRPAEELLRDRPHQHGQLHRAGLRSGPREGRPRTTAATSPFPFGSNSTIVTTGSVGSDTPNWNYGQVASRSGPNYPTPLGVQQHDHPPTITATNGCIYPTDIAHPLRPVQRGRRELEGLRPGPRRRPAHRLDLVRDRQRAGP